MENSNISQAAPTWLLTGLQKYWQKKAQEMVFNDFLLLYVNLMLLQNKETGMDFWAFLGLKKQNDLQDLYLKLRKN